MILSGWMKKKIQDGQEPEGRGGGKVKSAKWMAPGL